MQHCSIEGSHLTSQVQRSQHAAMLGGKLSVAGGGGLGTFTHMFVLGNYALSLICLYWVTMLNYK